MLPDDRQHGGTIHLALGQQFGEHRRLHDAEPDVEADADQYAAERERDPPPPGETLLTGHLTEAENREIGEEKSARNAKLRPGGDEPARLVATRPFHRHQHRTAPFAADADTLDEAQHRE